MSTHMHIHVTHITCSPDVNSAPCVYHSGSGYKCNFLLSWNWKCIMADKWHSSLIWAAGQVAIFASAQVFVPLPRDNFSELTD